MKILHPTTPEYSMPGIIEHHVSLKEKNWFQTGGFARYYAAPSSTQQFQQALTFARTHALPIFVLGKGANVLISDDGFDGLVIHPNLNLISHTINHSDAIVTAGAGVEMSTLIEYCLQHTIIGLEEFSGIPGTVGGSLYINLHYFEFLLEHFLLDAEIINKDTGDCITVDKAWFNFGYNQSTLQHGNYYVLSARFALRKCSDIETAYARGRRIEIIRHRTSRYPSTHTCGSFFRNFHPHEVTLEISTKKMIYVAYYLDKIGVKGALKVGDARVSHQHANMLVNGGSATSTDLITLARTMQELVNQNFGIIPKPECLLIGFKTYPLLI